MDERHRQLLLDTAAVSLRHGVEHGSALIVEVSDYDEELRRPRACFVTLRQGVDLRGCMGSSQPRRALIEDVALNAYAAGFLDPRFRSLQESELDDLDLRISVLSEIEAMSFTSEEDLLSQVRPGVDGLLLQESHHRGTLLPAVWDSLTDPRVFLRELKLKAGLTADYWSDSLRMFRYTAETFP